MQASSCRGPECHVQFGKQSGWGGSPLQKLYGGRGIVAGDIVRRIVARTMSQQLMSEVQHATAPFQHALTKSGRESIAHALQGSTELNPRTRRNKRVRFDLTSGHVGWGEVHCSGIGIAVRIHVMGIPQVICGKMQLARCTPSRRVKEENGATQWCLCCSR